MPEGKTEEVTVGFSEDLGLELDFSASPEETGSDELLGAAPVAKSTSEEDAMFADPLAGIGDEPAAKEEKTIDEKFEDLINSDKTDLINEETPGIVDDKSKETAESTEKANKNTETKETSGSLTVAFAKILQERGYSDFNEEEYLEAVKEKGEAEAYIDLLDKIDEQRLASTKSTLDNYSQEYIKFREAGFTVEQAQTMTGNVESIESITDEQVQENEKLQENIVREVERLKGTTPEEIDENIQLLKDTDKLTGRAVQNKTHLLNYHKNLAKQEYDNKQAQIKADQEASKAYTTELRADIDSTTEIIKGRKINQQTKDKIYDLIMKPVKKEDGSFTNALWAKRSKDPKAFDKKLAYFISSGLFDGDTKTLTTDARTKAIANMKDTLNSGREFSTGSPAIDNDKKIVDRIEAMKGFLED